MEQRFNGDERHQSMVSAIQQIASFNQLNPTQAEYYLGLAGCVRPVRVVSAYEVWSPDRVKQLIRAIRPAVKECYRVAFNLAVVTGGEARYVEGQMWASVLGVDHAFNYIPKLDVYVDFTAEFALQRDPAEGAYVAFRDFDLRTVEKIVLKNGYYGNIYNEVWLRERKKKIRAKKGGV